METSSNWIFTGAEKQTITSLIEKGRAEQGRNEKFAVIDFDSFFALLNENEIAIIKKFLALDATTLGYKTPYLGVPSAQPDLVALRDQIIVSDTEHHTIPTQYLPEEAFKAYGSLNTAMERDIGKRVLVLYGYRSPARQAFIFFDILKNVYDFDFEKTLHRVCLADYSEHVCFQKQAIDFTTRIQGQSEDFDKTQEYEWLKKHAAEFGFFESYPKNNSFNMMYEPWHWHYEV